MNDLNIIRSGFYKKRYFHLVAKKECLISRELNTLWRENDGHGMQTKTSCDRDICLKSREVNVLVLRAFSRQMGLSNKYVVVFLQ